MVVVVDCEEEEEEDGVVSTRMMEWRERGSFVGGRLGKVWWCSVIDSTSSGRYQVQLLFSLERQVPCAPVGEIISLCLGMIALS